MKTVKEKVLSMVKPYTNFGEHKDLIAFSLGECYLSYDYELGEDLPTDFEELIVVVEKDWLFKLMKKDGVENPLNYLQNEYTWGDSYEWFNKAVNENKVVVVGFN